MADDGGRAPDVSEQRAAVELVAKALGRYDAPEHWDWREYEEPACMVVAALAADPASVLATLLAEHPDATIAALETLLTSDEAVEASATAVAAEYYGGWGRGFTATESAGAALAAACRSLRPKAPKGTDEQG
jgi:hypothetical protein